MIRGHEDPASLHRPHHRRHQRHHLGHAHDVHRRCDNYGFQPGFLAVWFKAAAVGYFVGVPLLMLIVPHVQRFVMRRAAM
jgi:hypothetical protein